MSRVAAAWLWALAMTSSSLEGNARAAVQAARRAVGLSPYRESGDARLMECRIAAGNRAEAVGVYELRELLADTLGISPTPDVEALYLRARG